MIRNCKFCNVDIDDLGINQRFAAHTKYCDLNPNKKIRKQKNISADNNLSRAEKISITMKEGFKSGRLKIKPCSDAAKKQLSLKSKKFNKEYWTEEKRKEHSTRMLKIVQKHSGSYSANNVCGRNKNIEYSGSLLNSTWEYKFVSWCDKNKIECERNEKGFTYEWSGSRTYYPDFYLPGKDIYVEIKGYERERDRCKWKVFPNELIVLKKNEIKDIENGSFQLKK